MKYFIQLTGEYIGWHSTPGDPIDQFMESGKTIYVEGIRQSLETDEYFLFVYIRNDEGYY
ncbi:hypothetical protein GGQ84_002185 [Desulfitispora alkaliphila]|uniref:hypothetical protein n=1 Tax=Desulfitispora alkaliphila TaxID=622674 RepID=UPI003D1C1AEF